jgi:hypothetical protein
MNIRADPEQTNKACSESQTNEHYACSVFVCSLPTLRGLTLRRVLGFLVLFDAVVEVAESLICSGSDLLRCRNVQVLQYRLISRSFLPIYFAVES